jgi:cytochrome oxidase Cu insertion factor (SCO1/SenC/PrrC family)
MVLCVALAFAGFGDATKAQTGQVKREAVQYVCPMHPEVKSKKPGKCPQCGMRLRAEETGAGMDKEATADKRDASISPPQISDIVVTDQDGRRLNFNSDLVQGKTVVINFIFTTCTTICPPLTATFRKLQQSLGARAGREVQLISISVDPLIDVPERLKSFAAKFDAGPGWTFVTGSQSEIDQLLKALGVAVANKTEHTPMILIGNAAAGYWTRTYGLAPVSTLLKAVDEAASKTATTNASATVQSGNETKPAMTPTEVAAHYFPNLTLLTQDNKPVRFFDDLLKGKTVVINFAFTTCTGVCPPMTANLARVQEYLGDRVGKDITMITITVDPAVDTPAALKAYAEKFKVKPGWYFLTGRKEDIDHVLHKVGGYVEDKADHTNILIVGNVETGEWMKVFAMAKPEEIAAAITKVAAKAQQ